MLLLSVLRTRRKGRGAEVPGWVRRTTVAS
jgi:hypothetical protein